MGADAWLMANAGALVKDHCSQIVSASREEIYRVPSSFLFPVNRRMPPAGALWRQWKTPRRRRAALAQGFGRGWRATPPPAVVVPGMWPGPMLSLWPSSMPTSSRAVFRP